MKSLVKTHAVQAVIGGQWGDEGKGKLVDLLAQDVDLVCRYNGGANAGHTIVADGKKYKLNILPSGIVNKKTINIIGNGVVVHVPHLFKELESLGFDYTGRLLISDRAHLLFDFHQVIDRSHEKSLGKDEIGTTKKGIGPCYSAKAERINLRMGDLRHWNHFEENLRKLIKKLCDRFNFEYDVEGEVNKYKDYREKLLPMITDTTEYIHKAMKSNKKVLIEGANAVMLDIDFGTYPFVTSSSPSIGGACTGLGIPPTKVKNVYGVIKAYCTRVGAGPFPTELTNEIGKTLQTVGHEFGTTTGRERRCGWIDLPAIRFAHMINDFTALCMTKLDVLTGLKEIYIGNQYKLNGQYIDTVPASLELYSKVEVDYVKLPGWSEDISSMTDFEQLPKAAQQYIQKVEELLGIPIRWVGTGPSREAFLQRDEQ